MKSETSSKQQPTPQELQKLNSLLIFLRKLKQDVLFASNYKERAKSFFQANQSENGTTSTQTQLPLIKKIAKIKKVGTIEKPTMSQTTSPLPIQKKKSIRTKKKF